MPIKTPNPKIRVHNSELPRYAKAPTVTKLLNDIVFFVKDKLYIIAIPPLSIYLRDWRGLSRENLDRHISVKSKGVDVLRKASSAPASVAFSQITRNFKLLEGRRLRSHCTRDRGITHDKILISKSHFLWPGQVWVVSERIVIFGGK